MGKIFGREPALILAVVASSVMMITTFVYPLSSEQQGAVNAVAMALVGIVTAWAVAEDGGLALIIGLAKAVIALAISFGLHWTPEAQSVVMGFITVIAQLFVRQNVIAPIRADGTAATGKTLTD